LETGSVPQRFFLSPKACAGIIRRAKVRNKVLPPLLLQACGGTNTSGPKLMQQMAVRRLTPVECERLQGFPDDYTNIKPKCPDGPRYKAMGNSMAVPVMRWIGQRIKEMA